MTTTFRTPSSNFSWEAFSAAPLVAIIRNFDESTCLKLAEACIAVGIVAVEVTLNSPSALKTIAKLVERSDSGVSIGAGTVCTFAELERSLDAGAAFIVTPTVSLPVISTCVERRIPIFAGAMTPTEILTAGEAGADVVKVFPANTLGPEYISLVRGPLDSIRLLPTGGISPENIPDYCKAGAFGFGIGGSLFPREEISKGNFAEVRRRARSFLDAYRSAQF